MDVSCILLTWNSEKHLKESLSALINELNESRCSFKIFIVDNGSKDKTSEILTEFKNRYPENILPIYLHKNTGTTYSRNLALKKAKGFFIVILDSDVVVTKGALRTLIEFLGHNERVGLVVPKIVYQNGGLQKSTDRFPTVFTKLTRYFFLRLMEKRESTGVQCTEPYEVDYAISAMWILRREVLEKVGLLDEKIFYAPEDVDYCLRIWRAGYKVNYHPGAIIIHHTQEISRNFRINNAFISHMRGLAYYFRKHGYIIRRPEIRKAE